ncbi:type 4 pilus major pilin [Paraburkholderia megapolitana]|uniref:type 4 pilus major pilin n=1 Tax=Paraburkholderia megapolitana TaxID=420953 RepID=UPI0038B75240
MSELLGTWYGKLLMLLALAAAAVLAMAALAQNRAEAQLADLTQLMGNARQAFGNSSDGYRNFVNGNLANLIAAGIIPAQMVRNGQLVDRWGDVVSIEPAWDTRNSMAGRITFGGSESTEDCVRVILGMKDFDALVVSALAFTADSPPAHDAYSAGLVTQYCGVSYPAGSMVTVTFS